jgi:integrase
MIGASGGPGAVVFRVLIVSKTHRGESMGRKRRGRGEGGISLRPDGWWVGRISLGFTAEGKRRRKSIYARSKSELLKKMDDARGDLRLPPPSADGGMTLGQLLDRFLASGAERNSARTTEERERLVKNHLRPRLGHVKLAGLSDLNIDFLLTGMRADGVGSWTVRNAVDLLSMACRYGVRKKFLRSNPCEGADKPSPARREIHPLTADQARALLSAARDRPVYPLLAVALGTGCRMGELLGLSRRDVDLKAGTVTIRKSLSKTKASFGLKEPKTKAGRRTISLPAFAREPLSTVLASTPGAGPVFRTRTGGYLDKKNVLRALRAVIRRANRAIEAAGQGDAGPAPIPANFRFHDLRHTVASNLLSSGHSVRAVALRLGHSDPAMTLRVYAHVMPADDARLAGGLEHLFT